MRDIKESNMAGRAQNKKKPAHVKNKETLAMTQGHYQMEKVS